MFPRFSWVKIMTHNTLAQLSIQQLFAIKTE